MNKFEQCRELLNICYHHYEEFFSYSDLLDFLDAGGDKMQELSVAARTEYNRKVFTMYFEEKRRIKREER